MHYNSVACEKCTKIAKAIGSENIGRERTILGHLALMEVNSFAAMPLENKGKLRALPQTENRFDQDSGGGDGTGIERSLPSKSLK
ncbi:MAG: hypothetical protein AAFR90_13665 [Pseudomonadota bacterium]